MADHTSLADMHVAADRLGRNHALGLNCHIVSNVHLDILHMPMLLAKRRSNNHILLDNDISSEIYRCHITPHDNLRMHHVFALHADILQALQNHILADLILFLGEEVELRLVVFGHRFHFCLCKLVKYLLYLIF